jgi:hypothetical protein
MSHGADDSDNYWPGYVDALTSMVQVLAFVMMMLAMAVFVLSQSVSKQAVEAIAKAVNAEVSPNSNMKQVTQAVMDKLKTLASPGRTSEPERDRSEAPEKGSIKPVENAAAIDPNAEKIIGLRVAGARTRNEPVANQAPNTARLTIGFDEHSSRVEQESVQSVNKFIGDQKVVDSAQNVIITAYAYSGDGALSEARRLAYYRAMMTRKELIHSKVKAENIRINVNDTADKARGSTVEMTVAGGSTQ